MASFLRIYLLVLLVMLAQSAIIQQTSMSLYARQRPENSMAYIQRLYHKAAVTYKTANSAAVGSLTITLPFFLGSSNLAACANAKSVATYTTLSPVGEASAIVKALQDSAGSPGVGLSAGTTIQTANGPITAACTISAGAAVIQTQVTP